MKTEKNLEIMQNMYAASVAETVNTFEKLKVLDYIVSTKKERLNCTAPLLNKQLEITTPEEVFKHMSEVFGCANWKVEKTLDGFIATASSCKLCALSKNMGGANPCNGWCLNPMSAMLRAINQSIHFTAESTLMNGKCCKVKVKIKE